MDLDELILPRDNEIRTWKEMLEREPLKKIFDNSTSICFREEQMIETDEVLRLLSTSQNMTSEESQIVAWDQRKESYFLTHIHAIDNPKLDKYLKRTKCIQKLDSLVMTSVHFPMYCVGNNTKVLGDCKGSMVPIETVTSYHYRTVCSSKAKQEGLAVIHEMPCSLEELKRTKLEKHMTTWKYKDELLKAVGRVSECLHDDACV